MSLEDAIANLEIDLSEKITNLTTEVRWTDKLKRCNYKTTGWKWTTLCKM